MAYERKGLHTGLNRRGLYKDGTAVQDMTCCTPHMQSQDLLHSPHAVIGILAFATCGHRTFCTFHMWS
eukprot:1158037-Pelagomonas_calceolata.AAC.3